MTHKELETYSLLMNMIEIESNALFKKYENIQKEIFGTQSKGSYSFDYVTGTTLVFSTGYCDEYVELPIEYLFNDDWENVVRKEFNEELQRLNVIKRERVNKEIKSLKETLARLEKFEN